MRKCLSARRALPRKAAGCSAAGGVRAVSRSAGQGRRFRQLVPLSLLLAALLLLVPLRSLSAREFRKALPGYRFEFPRDHASHEQYKTEWWYFTGHLLSSAGKRYGYELTFFRVGTDEQPAARAGSPFHLDNVYLAHFAVADVSGKRFSYYEKINRRGLGLAGARSDVCSVFNERWSAERLGDRIVIRADGSDYAISLVLAPAKGAVVHGRDGVSQKASCAGCASHYYSLTRLHTQGVLYHGDRAEPVTGESWMDHEFGSSQLTAEQSGWDWFGIQLDDDSEIMLYSMRRSDGTVGKFSSGTFVTAGGSCSHLPASSFKINVHDHWKSEKSGGRYPASWSISIPQEQLQLQLTPELADQELITTGSTGVTYWEGCVRVVGSRRGKPVKGRAYVELTGYAKRFDKRL